LASCNADNSCKNAGIGSTGAITSNLKNCCNTVSTPSTAPGVCESATQATLPKQCNSKVRRYSIDVTFYYYLCFLIHLFARLVNRFLISLQSAKKRARD
jgi:hypothetical protein